MQLGAGIGARIAVSPLLAQSPGSPIHLRFNHVSLVDKHKGSPMPSVVNIGKYNQKGSNFKPGFGSQL